MPARLIVNLGDLADDLRAAAITVRTRGAEAVRDSAQDGNRTAARLARVSAGAHGKHYHKAFTVERESTLAYEYGPDSARPQGGMSFEMGSRNQPPHNDLAKSLDLIRPRFHRGVSDVLDEAFWRGR